MLKKLSAALAIAAMLAASPVLAVTGQAPVPGPALQDGNWLNGLAGGQNETYQAGITAAGTNQATAAPLPAGIALIEVDTVASGTGVNVPFCIAGMEFSVYNNGANTLTFYPAVANNPLTGSQDTINNSTSTTIGSHTPIFFGCAKNGVWSAK